MKYTKFVPHDLKATKATVISIDQAGNDWMVGDEMTIYESGDVLVWDGQKWVPRKP
jgi:hypothetical protein